MAFIDERLVFGSRWCYSSGSCWGLAWWQVMARCRNVPAFISSCQTLCRDCGGSRSGTLWAFPSDTCRRDWLNPGVLSSFCVLLDRYMLRALAASVIYHISIHSLPMMRSVLTICLDPIVLLRFESLPCSVALIDSNCTCNDRSYTEDTVCDDVSRRRRIGCCSGSRVGRKGSRACANV